MSSEIDRRKARTLSIDRSLVEKLVREKLNAALKKCTSSQPLEFVNEKIILERGGNSTIFVTPKVIITPLARDMAEQIGISFKTSAGIPLPTVENVSPQTIVLGADHGGFSLKETLKKELKIWGYSVLDIGTHTPDPVDYPDFAHPVASLIGKGLCQRGILIDGAGIGSAIVANKVGGVRAAHCTNLFEVKNSREHNNANILTLGAGVIGNNLAIEMVRVWLTTPFAGGRHQRRVDKIADVERQETLIASSK